MDSYTQLLKGTLDGGILLVVAAHRELYGYELSATLAEYGFDTVRSGSIYPALLRLEKEAYINSILRESPKGPPRKYYRITEKGRNYMQQFITAWRGVNQSIESLIQEAL